MNRRDFVKLPLSAVVATLPAISIAAEDVGFSWRGDYPAGLCDQENILYEMERMWLECVKSGSAPDHIIVREDSVLARFIEDWSNETPM